MFNLLDVDPMFFLNITSVVYTVLASSPNEGKRTYLLNTLPQSCNNATTKFFMCNVIWVGCHQ